jgi:hypothetical protein
MKKLKKKSSELKLTWLTHDSSSSHKKSRKNHKDQGLKPTNLLSNNKIQNKIIQKNI